ncbi:MAG: hypothetical protein IJW18_03720 [Lachnospiraceae bacterium]|nr:hypothetical protein [Lachnospiraceae bacterium]
MISIEEANEEQLSEMKGWFFKENIRIQQENELLLEEHKRLEEEKRLLAAERRRLEQDKRCLEQEQARLLRIRQRLDKDNELFNDKTAVLIDEIRRLADDKEKLARDKARFAREKTAYFERKNREAKKAAATASMQAAPKMFFVGVDNEVALKKRYRELLKIFHPDNTCGNTDVVICINKEYDALKNLYCTG